MLRGHPQSNQWFLPSKLIQEYSRNMFYDLKSKREEGTSGGRVHWQPLLFNSFKTRASAYNEAAANFLAILGNILQGGCIAQDFDKTGLYLK